ncbi:spermidine/putrescine ABC transporter substrate-binding protein [Castellaniella sp. MT123]|uniref:polyamine ABC transporter substrate-binding protein n=1 Tax=Castellaniella sp. MT123 TaxID=3140381 RepID=UPI0031F3E7CB|nr:spermidine/putrescine ABC transporter substrate-binding protein [Castellaniella sp.]
MKLPLKRSDFASRRRFVTKLGGLVGAAAVTSALPLRSALALEQLTMLTWNGFAEREVVGDFVDKHGVKIRAKYYTGGDEMLALISQSPPGTYDVILADGEYVQQLRTAGYIEKLNPADYPFNDYFPEFRRFPMLWHENDMYALLMRFGFLGVSFNTKYITDEQASSYEMFWDKKLKGKVAHFDWHLPNLGQMSLLNGDSKPYDIDAAAWQKVQDRTMSLRPQIAGFFGYGGTLSALKTEQVHAMLGIGDWITGLLARDGGSFKTVVPKEGGLQWDECLCIGKGSQKVGLATKFLQYMSTPEGQVKAATMKAYPALIPNQEGWKLLAKVNHVAAERGGMLMDEYNVMNIIREGRIHDRQLPVQQSLQDWNNFWQKYKSA